MSAAVKPATPLPWAVGMREGANGNLIMSHTGEGMHNDPAICQMYGISMNRRVEELQDAEGMQNARYLVHAANAYPKLVEALCHDLMLFDLLAKESPARDDHNFAGYVVSGDRIRFLLRELGEAA